MRHYAKADSQHTIDDNSKINHGSSDKAVFATFGALLFATSISGLALSGFNAFATQTCTTDATTGAYTCTTTDSDTVTASANASVTVAAACTMSATGTSHTASPVPGNFTGNIGGNSNVTIVCNDSSGYAVYAVGYTGDSLTGENHTKLVATTGGNTIPSCSSNCESTSASTSTWSMKLAQGTASSASPSQAATIESTYASYAPIPASYTKVASFGSSTSGTSGTAFTTTYGVYIASSQPAGTYTGQVKYTLVHPSTAPAPTS